MIPSFKINYSGDFILSNSKRFTQNILSQSISILFPYIPYLLNRQFVPGISLSKYAHSFIAHIGVIIRSVSKPQMFRINTLGTICFWTIMKHTKIIWNWATMKNPRSSMGTNQTRVSCPFLDRPISSFKQASSPKPTGFSFLNLCKESFRECGGEPLRFQILFSNVGLHNKLVLFCRALGCWFSAEAFSLCNNQILKSS